MATEVIIPALGVVVEKVKIVNWFKGEGDRVEKGEPLLEIESDKVMTEIVSPASGVLGSVLYEAGAEVGITMVVAVIVGEGESVPETYRQKATVSAPPAVPTPPSAVSPEAELRQPANAAPVARKLAEEKGVDLSLVKPTGPHGTIMKKDVEAYLASKALEEEKKPHKVSGVARKVAAEFQVDLEVIQGTGISGRIMKADVLKALEPSPPLKEGERPAEQVIPMSKMRQVIARRLSESAFTAPHIYLFTEVEMGKVLDLRESILEEFERRFGIRLSVNDFLIKAVALTIREFPFFNASVRGNEIHIHPEINVGLAVALDEGLIVPAIPNTDKLGLGQIVQQRAELVERARKGKLTIEEIQRGTFTISSLSNFDISFFTAIINPPQTGILSVGKIQDQLFLEKGEVKAKRVSTFGLSSDHRIIDGAVAAKFLQTLKKRMENPIFSFLDL